MRTHSSLFVALVLVAACTLERSPYESVLVENEPAGSSGADRCPATMPEQSVVMTGAASDFDFCVTDNDADSGLTPFEDLAALCFATDPNARTMYFGLRLATSVLQAASPPTSLGYYVALEGEDLGFGAAYDPTNGWFAILNGIEAGAGVSLTIGSDMIEWGVRFAELGRSWPVTLHTINGYVYSDTIDGPRDGIVVCADGVAVPQPTAIDDTPPTAGTVNDGVAAGVDLDTQTSTTRLAANWSGFADADSGITGYEWALGSAAGADDVQPFTSIGTATSAAAPGLSLTVGSTYFATVRATNGVGLTTTATSNGVTVTAAPAGCGANAADAAVTCLDLRDNCGVPDGVYWINPDGTTAFQAYCDMTTDDGGWTLLVTFPKTQKPFATMADWPSAPDTTGGEPTVAGMYKGALDAFTEVREEITSGAHVVWAKGLTVVALETIRKQYSYGERLAAAPNTEDRPSCRTSYAGATDDVVGCAESSGPSTDTVTGFQQDVLFSGWCWFARGGGAFTNKQGSSLCAGPGEPDGTKWARTWFR